MYKISVVMIIKNEAENLQKTLPVICKIADEIILLDSGSDDNSQEIGKRYGAQWFVNTDWQGFGKQRQIAQNYAHGDWIFALDADEIPNEKMLAAITRLKNEKPENTVYGLRRLNSIFGLTIDPYPPRRTIKPHWRIYPRTFTYNNNLVHESLITDGAKLQVLDGFLIHHTAKTPQFLLQKHLQYAFAWAEDHQQKGKKSSFFPIFGHSFFAFLKQYIGYRRFLCGQIGFVYSVVFAYYTFNKYAMLFLLNHQKLEKSLFDQTIIDVSSEIKGNLCRITFTTLWISLKSLKKSSVIASICKGQTFFNQQIYAIYKPKLDSEDSIPK